MAALDGIHVVDLSRYLSGPTLTMLLARLDADVIKASRCPAVILLRNPAPCTAAGQE